MQLLLHACVAGDAGEGREVAVSALYAAAERVDAASSSEQRDAALRKKFGAAQREGAGQLEHEVGTAADSEGSTLPFAENCRLTSLHEAAAHCDDDRLLREPFRLPDMILMTVMKGIIFCDNACSLHN